MGLKQQIINNYVDDIRTGYSVSKDVAFLMYSHTLIMNQGSASFDSSDIVDGGQDKQIDAFTIEENDGSADVYITQATTSSSFSSNKLIQLGNGLRWVLEAPRRDLDRLPNIDLRDKIIRFREIQSDLGPSNIKIIVSFVANASTDSASQEFRDEMKRIRDSYDDETYEKFSVEAIGIEELTQLAKMRDTRIRSVDADLKIKYDRNAASAITYFSQGLKGGVYTISGTEIAKLVNSHPDGKIFDMNIRQYLGTRGTVNRDILETASGDKGYEFWFLNNGITIVCDKFDSVFDPDNPIVKIKNLQIVNGCQTASSLGRALAEDQLKKDVNVVVRIYETNDMGIVNKIVMTTNNQNHITSRNLRANDSIQVSLGDAFEMKGYYYERKPRQYESVRDASIIFTNEEVGQAYLALALRNPSDARSRRYKLWDEFNKDIYSDIPVEQYIFASLLVRRLSSWLRTSKHVKSDNTQERTLAKRGLYHIARVVAFILMGSDTWDDTTLIKRLLTELEKGSLDEADTFEKAYQLTFEVFKKSHYADDVERGVKSNQINKLLDKELYAQNNVALDS